MIKEIFDTIGTLICIIVLGILLLVTSIFPPEAKKVIVWILGVALIIIILKPVVIGVLRLLTNVSDMFSPQKKMNGTQTDGHPIEKENLTIQGEIRTTDEMQQLLQEVAVKNGITLAELIGYSIKFGLENSKQVIEYSTNPKLNKD